MKLILLIFLILLGGSIAIPAIACEDINLEFGEDYRNKEHVYLSLVRIIAAPAEFDKRRVLTEGYIHFSGWEVYLFIREDDHTNSLTKNAVSIGFAEGTLLNVSKECYEKMNNSYVQVSGIYSAIPDDAFSLTSGAIVDIDYIRIKRTKSVNFNEAPFGQRAVFTQ